MKQNRKKQRREEARVLAQQAAEARAAAEKRDKEREARRAWEDARWADNNPHCQHPRHHDDFHRHHRFLRARKHAEPPARPAAGTRTGHRLPLWVLYMAALGGGGM